MRLEDWRRYVAPAAFLLAVTIAVVLIRSGMNAGGNAAKAPVVPPTPRKHVVTTTTKKPSRRITTTTAQTGQQYWTVAAGDTFGVISSKSGVPVATIEKLNPTVSSTALFIGEKIRLR